VSIVAPELTFTLFSTVRSRCSVRGAGAKAYFEVEIKSQGSYPQFGFCSPDFTASPDYQTRGTGDDTDSWGVDGDRVLSWHNGSNVFGSEWRAGDIIGFAVNLGDANATAGQFLVSYNGDFALPNGVVFDLPPGLPAIYASLTAGSGSYSWNLGGVREFRYSPPSPDYQAFAAVATAPVSLRAIMCSVRHFIRICYKRT
jgi:hypothetical protein